MRTALAVLLACALGACQGDIEGPAGPGGGVDAGPGGGGPDAGEVPCGDTGEVILFFERSCAGCHQGSRYPDLSREGLAALSTLESRLVPGEPLLVPGDPEASFLYRKMAHTQGEDGGAGMPLGRSAPVGELGLVARWIGDGAPLACDELAPPVVDYDPDALDPEALFQCAEPDAPRSSPSRVRRMGREELVHVAVGGYNNGAKIGNNPLTTPESLPYSTYAEGVGMGTATLNLLLLHLPEASLPWSRYDPHGAGGARMAGVYRTDIVRCMEDAEPTDECIDGYVDTLLRRHALFRAPTDGERSRLRAHLVELLALEASAGSERSETLHELAQTSLLMAGALFRSDLGDPATMNDAGERELTNDELALALGSVLSPAPPGAPINITFGVSDDDPDAGDTAAGRLGRIAAAAADGSIRDPEVRRALFRHYASGVSAERPDLRLENPRAATRGRGEWWLAPRLAGFFREWLGYESASTVFKDHPAETSAFPSDGSQYDLAVVGWGNTQTPTNGIEATLVQQLDAVIARVVIETDASGEDVFEELLTTRTWLLPANRAVSTETACDSDADCSDGRVCPERIGRCSGSTWKSYFGITWPYGVAEEIEATDAERWVTFPEGSPRLGVLTHPAWLAAHGGNFEDDASLVLRGNWVRRKLFCQSFGDLSDVQGLQAMLVPSQPDLSARQRVRYSTEPGVDPAGDDATTEQCFGCHQFMNSLGFPFEAFNHAGYERAEDHGAPPDGSTVVDNLPDPALNRSYGTTAEFVEALAGSRYARRGMVRQAFRYFMGRDETLEDGCTLVEMEAALDETGSFLAMVEALVASESFERRRLEGAPMGEGS